jgi:hypothetical protein
MAQENENKEEKIDISDVIIEGEEAAAPDAKPEPKEDKPAPEPTDDHDDDHDDDEHQDDNDGATDDEREAIRQRRREERAQRKEFRRNKEDQARRRIQALENERSELAQRLAILERRTTGSEIAQIDAAINEADAADSMLKRQIQSAIETNDGASVAEATDMLYRNRQRRENLERLKQAAIRGNSAPPQQQQATQPNPRVTQNARDWVSKNNWFDPQGQDVDSRVARTVDQALADEGYDPSDPEYWNELTSRLKTYLPHRYTAPRKNNPPPSTTTGGGSRDASPGANPNKFVLSKERVQAIKEAGMWDDPDKRAKMIQQYRNFDKQGNK